METVVVTGANRGMGLEFCRQYLARGARVFAGVRSEKSRRDKLDALQKQYPDRLKIIPLDVGNEDSIRESAKIVADQTDAMDVLVNNAGLGGVSRDTGKMEELGTFHFDDAWVVIRTMAVGPLLMVQEYLPMLKKSGHARVGNVSSGYGSISGNNNRSPYYYSAAKATMHQLMRSFAAEGKAFGITTVLLDPGWVQTDMGGPNAPLPVDQSIAGMIKVMDALTVENTGRFVKWDGTPMPW
jgi:NAD(P)-dependent dehydrogenase (short-subunit alcohol dehydrogenase family)